MPTPTSIRTPLFVFLLAAIVFGLGVWGLYTSDAAVKAREREARLTEAQAAGPAEVGPTLEVSVWPAATVESTEVIELAGVLEPVRSTWVAAELAGRVIDIPAQEHSPIESGGVLARLDPSLPRAEMIRAEALHAFAKTELERQRRLGSQSVASEAELERASAEERRTFAALLEARTRVAHTRITAPFDGLVNALDLDPGAYVQPGTRIAEVLDVSRIEITVLVSDRQIAAIAPGMSAHVRIDSLGSERFEAPIVRVGGATQAGSQRYPVVVELDNAPNSSPNIPPKSAPMYAPNTLNAQDIDRIEDTMGRFRPGMLAHVLLEVGTQPAIRLPARAVIHEFELDYVFVLDDEDSARRVRVSTRPVPFRPDQVEIREGLTEGDRVVVTAVSQLRDGLRVRVR